MHGWTACWRTLQHLYDELMGNPLHTGFPGLPNAVAAVHWMIANYPSTSYTALIVFPPGTEEQEFIERLQALVRVPLVSRRFRSANVTVPQCYVFPSEEPAEERGEQYDQPHHLSDACTDDRDAAADRVADRAANWWTGL
jgi:hypothetical protein